MRKHPDDARRAQGAGATGATSASNVPVVAAVAPFAFLATMFVARWGFGTRSRTLDELRAGLEAERSAREELAVEVAELRARTAQ